MDNLTRMLNLFGTAGKELTCEIALKAGQAFALAFWEVYGHAPKVFLGRDTRISSDALAAAVTAGLLDFGADVADLSVLPLPAASYLASKYSMDALILVMGENADAYSNEIRFLNRYGCELEKNLAEKMSAAFSDSAAASAGEKKPFGRLVYHKAPCEEYVRHLSAKISGSCDGVRIYLDCANGTVAFTAKAFFTRMEAECIMASDVPDGLNLYENSGFLSPALLSENTRKHRCHLGVAFDNTGKKLILSDENGTIIEMDKLITGIALALKNSGELNNEKLGIIKEANRGIVTFAHTHGIRIREATSYQDWISYAYSNDIGLASDSRDEVLLKDIIPVPDAQAAAAILACALSVTDKKLSKLLSGFEHYPQVIIKVKAEEEQKVQFVADGEISYWVYQANRQLKNEGVIKAYPLEGEPYIAVFAEGKHFEQINTMLTDLGKKIAGRLNAMPDKISEKA